MMARDKRDITARTNWVTLFGCQQISTRGGFASHPTFHKPSVCCRRFSRAHRDMSPLRQLVGKFLPLLWHHQEHNLFSAVSNLLREVYHSAGLLGVSQSAWKKLTRPQIFTYGKRGKRHLGPSVRVPAGVARHDRAHNVRPGTRRR